jgi:2-dehydropantoate 2-reductase
MCSLQNRLNEHEIAQVVGKQRTIGAPSTSFGADYLEPSVVTYRAVARSCSARSTGGSRRASGAARTMLDFDDAAIVTDNIWGYLWGKLGYGALLFATLTSVRSPTRSPIRPTHGSITRSGPR